LGSPAGRPADGHCVTTAKDPAGRYIASPNVHHGASIEVDVATYEKFDLAGYSTHSGGNATQTWPGPLDLQTEAELAINTYEVNVYDAERDQQLVAAIELVSPANKDRLESRRLFAAKCANLVQAGVAVSIVDIITIRQFNLYAEMMDLLGHPLTAPARKHPHPYTWLVAAWWNCSPARKSVLSRGRARWKLGNHYGKFPCGLRSRWSCPSTWSKPMNRLATIFGSLSGTFCYFAARGAPPTRGSSTRSDHRMPFCSNLRKAGFSKSAG
jgi:hypothetical protein